MLHQKFSTHTRVREKFYADKKILPEELAQAMMASHLLLVCPARSICFAVTPRKRKAQCSADADAAPRLDAGAGAGTGSSRAAFPVRPLSAWPAGGRPSAASGARAQPGWRLPSDESAKAEPHGDQRGPGDRRLLSAGRRHCSAPVFLEPVLCHLSCARGFSTPPSVPTAPRLITANVFNQRHMFSEVKIRRR